MKKSKHERKEKDLPEGRSFLIITTLFGGMK